MVATYKTKRIILLLSILTLSFILFGSVAQAVTSTISKGYTTTDTTLVTGMAASLARGSEENQRLVEAATTANSEKFVGIITTVEDNLVAFSGQSTDVLISTEGEVTAYVSNLNGDIQNGDFLGLSPLKGVLMKSNNTRENRVIAIALKDFSDVKSEDKQVTTSQGEKTYKVGKIQIEISPNVVVNATESDNKTALVLAGESLTGKSVSQIQILAALVIFAIILIVEGSIIYGAIHSTVTALGRNPLAKKAVFKQLLQVSWIALMVLIVGFGAIYLIIWV